MGTSASNIGPRGKTPLLPSWAPEPVESGNNDNDQQSDSNDNKNEPAISVPKTDEAPFSDNWSGAKGSLSRFANKTQGSSLRKAAKNYVRSLGGNSNASKAASKGISVGGGYLNFLGDIRKGGFQQTLQNYGLSDCLGKSSEEVLAKIADKIAPIGSTNDEAIARTAIMLALDNLYEKLLLEGKDIDSLDSLTEETLKESVIEFVSAYIFKKWIYELGLALEKNELSEKQAIKLENEIRVFVRDEVKASVKDQDILKLDFTNGNGRKIIEDIFDLAYSTLEK